MNFFKKQYTIRRYSEPTYVRGYASNPYEDFKVYMDIQTTENKSNTAEDGIEAVQRLKTFCDEEIFTTESSSQKKADRVYFQGKWFECKTSRLSENTPLRHWTSTFIQCIDMDEPPA